MCEQTPRFSHIPHCNTAYLASGSGPGVPNRALRMQHYLREQYQASHNAPSQRPGIQTSQGNSDYASPGTCSAAQGRITRTQDSNGPVYVSVKQRVPNHPLSRRFTHTSPQSRSVPGHVAPVAVRQDASMTSPQQPPPTRGGEAVASPVLILRRLICAGQAHHRISVAN